MKSGCVNNALLRVAANGFGIIDSVLKQHEEEKRIKVIVKIFTYFLIIAALILLFVVVTRLEHKEETPSKNSSVSKSISHTKSAVLK